MAVANESFSDPVLDGMLDHRFGPSSVKLDDDQVRRICSMRDGMRILARHIAALCPPSWERDKALEALDEAHSWTAKSIARN